MHRTWHLRPLLLLVLVSVASPARANGGLSPLIGVQDGWTFRWAVTAYELAVVAVECWLIVRLFKQPWKRALAASSLANLVSFVLVSAFAVAAYRSTSGQLRWADDYLHFYDNLYPVLFGLNIVAEAPVIWRVCRLRFNLKFVACLILIQVFTWIPGTILFYPHPTPAQRSPVSRVKSDMRSMATALEAYFVDNKSYPPMEPMVGHVLFDPVPELTRAHGARLSVPMGLTTPVAYVTTMFPDLFAPGKAPFAYFADSHGWILFSPGPDRKYDIDPLYDYDSGVTQPTARLLMKSFDPTNGAVSTGDIFRLPAASDRQ